MNNTFLEKKADVIIIGGGPVGLVTALKLTLSGISVIVIEISDKPYAEPRASTFHPPTLDLLDQLGISSKLIEKGRKSKKWQFSFFNSENKVVFDLGILSNDTNHPYRLQCEQINLIKIASTILLKKNSESISYNTRAITISENTQSVSVKAIKGGENITFSGKWLVGADGANSMARKHINVKFEGKTYPSSSVSINTTFPFHDYINNLYGVNYFWSEDWSFSMFRTKSFWRVGYSPQKNLSDKEALNDKNIQDQLSKIVQIENRFGIQSAVIYRIHKRIVKSFRKGRVILAGDSAHLNSPSGGFGMNGGIHDAFNLCDKLIRIFNGSSDNLLDLYSRQRKYAAVSDIQETSDQNYKKHREKNHKKRLEALNELKKIKENKEEYLKYLRKTSLISSLKDASRIN